MDAGTAFLEEDQLFEDQLVAPEEELKGRSSERLKKAVERADGHYMVRRSSSFPCDWPLLTYITIIYVYRGVELLYD